MVFEITEILINAIVGDPNYKYSDEQGKKKI